MAGGASAIMARRYDRTDLSPSGLSGMSNAPFVVLSKLTPPITDGRVVERSLVDALLTRGDSSRLVLITAPAGYGKTTAAAAHFERARRDGGIVGWVSLDAEDRDPSHFLAHFIAALQTAHTGIGIAAQSLLGVGSAVPVRGVLLTLFNEIATVNERVTIVLDDFYRCASEEVVTLVDGLLEEAPQNLHVILTSRTAPGLRMLGRLRVQSLLTEIRVDHLRLEPAEANAFCNEMQGLGLSREQVMALHERTDGWIAGLQLAVLSLRDRSDRDRFIAEFAGDNRDIVEYLAGDVVANLPPETRAFLQETAILERLTAPLCDAVAGRKDSAAMLAELERANLFLLPLDDRRTWYRYHHLFADFLRRHLADARPDDIKCLHRRAYTWYADHRMIGEAVGHALAAGDLDVTAGFIESSWHDVIKVGRVGTLLGWMERLPASLPERRPVLRIAMCWALSLRRDRRRALEQFRLASEAIESPDFDRGDMSDRAYEALLQELRTTELFVHVFADAEEEMVAAVTDGEELTTEYDPFVHGVHDNLLIYASSVAGEYDSARRFAVRARERHMRSEGIYGAVYSDCLRGLVEVSTGDLASARMLYERALALASDRIGRVSVAAAMPAVLLSKVYYLCNDLERAQQKLDEMLHLVDECAILDAVLVGHRVLAQIHHVQGRSAQALDALAEAEAIGRRGGFDRLTISALSHRARILVQCGDLSGAVRTVDAAEQLAGPYPTGALARWSRRHVMVRQARAALQIAQGHPAAALETLMPVLAGAEAGGHIQRLVELLVLEVMARAAAGDERGATRQLRRALVTSAAAGMVRTYADEGEAMKPLVVRAWGHWVEGAGAPGSPVPREHIDAVLRAFASSDGEMPLAAPVEAHPGMSPIALSDRELEVLRPLFAGCSNKQIARHLCVAESTVAWHLKNIYTKLNVTNRTEAVAVAMRHSLL
jgi:ATP/maltotriose-dependent transcriptional regulator MalT